MKQIFIFLLAIIGVAYGQSSPTSSKTRFVNGLYVGTKLDSYFAAADSNAIYWRADSSLMAKYKGTARALAFAVSGGYIPYSDTTTLFGQVVRTFGTQTIGGNKTFTNDIFASTARIGIGAGGNTSNAVLGYNVFTANTTGTKNTAMGENSLSSNVSATDNTAFGWYSLDVATGSGNTGIGSGALGTNTSGSNNTALGFGAGEYITGTNPNTTGTNSIYIGFNTKAAANGETNQTVIGNSATGNGSNTVTIGNSSVTDNYFTGNIRGGAFIKSGGTSSQFLKADGSVDGTSYATAASLSGYLPLSGGTLTGALGGTSASFSGNVSTSGQYFRANQVADFYFNSNYSTGYAGIQVASNHGIEFATNNITRGRITAAGLWQLETALSGTSLSMSGGITTNVSFRTIHTGTSNEISYMGERGGAVNAGYIALRNANITKVAIDADGTSYFNGGDVLINTTTTDGTNKLIVNGGVKFGTGGTATITAAGAATFSSSVTASSFIRSGGTSSQALMADGSVQTVTSGTYSPTLTGVTNISSVTLDDANFTRVGSIVTVYVSGTVQTTASGASTFTLTVPIANVGSTYIGFGNVNNGNADGVAGMVSSSTTTAFTFDFNSINTTSRRFSISFQYSL